MDITTVVFQQELPILQCQAQSIELYCKDVETITVIVNEPAGSLEIDPTWWGSLSDRVHIIPRTAFGADWDTNGWITQQILKLLGAAANYGGWTMILDAKTIFTNVVSRDLMFDIQDRAKIGWQDIIPVFYASRDIANDLFNTNNTKVLIPNGVPFFLHNDSVRAMISAIESKTKMDFSTWFSQQGMITEFVLYSTWMSMNQWERFYVGNSAGRILKICNICHSTVDQFDDLIGKHNDLAHTLSIHRKAWASLSEAQKQSFKNRLLARGISQAGLLV